MDHITVDFSSEKITIFDNIKLPSGSVIFGLPHTYYPNFIDANNPLTGRKFNGFFTIHKSAHHGGICSGMVTRIIWNNVTYI